MPAFVERTFSIMESQLDVSEYLIKLLMFEFRVMPIGAFGIGIVIPPPT